MSFRRDGKKANVWRKRLETYPELLQRTGLPDVVLTDDRAFSFFLQEGCFQGAKGTSLVDALSFLSEHQQVALHQLFFKHPHRTGTDCAHPLESSRFKVPKEVTNDPFSPRKDRHSLLAWVSTWPSLAMT